MSQGPAPQPEDVTLADPDGHDHRVNIGFYDIVWALGKDGGPTWINVFPGTLTPAFVSRPGSSREDQR